MAIQLDFSGAEAQRLRITQEQQEQIRDLYRQASAEVGRLAEQAPRVPSDALRQQYLHTLQKQIDEQLRDIESQLNGTIRSSMTDTVKSTVTDAKAFLKENGLPINGAYSHVPADIVRSVASGQLYTGNWTLSRALWLNTAETQHDVQSVIAQGIIQNKSAYDIAKDLEKYVNPDARKDWEWSKVYPGTKKVVDYNAQRLARTMVSHAYQQAFVRTTQKNPFVTKYKWEASNSGRVCEICEERDGKLFDKDELPLDHPNGMCTFTAVMDDLEKIGKRLGDWADGKSDPDIDAWSKDLYGKSWEQKKEQETSLIPGNNSAEITDSIRDYFLPQGTRDRIPYIESLNSFDDFQRHFKSLGIQLDTDLLALSESRRFDTIPAVKELCEKIAVGVDTYTQLYGDRALSKLDRILLYSKDLDTTAAYYFNRAGENDPLAGTIAFRDWGANGRVVFHELAHAFQDSSAKPGEDAVSFSERMNNQAGLDPNYRAYSGAASDVIEAERFADAFGFGFYLGSPAGTSFIGSVQKELLEGRL